MKQQTLAGFEKYGKTRRRAQFLADMEQIIPWPELAAAVQTAYPQVSEHGGRPPIPLEWMLRIYFLQLWFNLSDPAVEEALYDSVAMRSFVGIDLGVEGAPDETTVCKFRHLLERNQLGKVLLTAVNDHLHRSGIKIARGTIVDATIIGAPSSTKNRDGKRDPEMHQTAKSQQWYFVSWPLGAGQQAAGGQRGLLPAAVALEQPAAEHAVTRVAAPGADEALRPAPAEQGLLALRLRAKAGQKLCQTHASLKLHLVLRHRSSPCEIKRCQSATAPGTQAEPHG